MIKSVIVMMPDHDTVAGEQLKLQLDDPWQTGLAISEITGLGPESASINTTDLATADGSVYNSARMRDREISFKLLPIETDSRSVEDGRLLTYKFFGIKQPVTLMFETDNRYAMISGYVKKNSPSIFSKNETLSITVACPDPYFYEASYNDITGRVVESITETVFGGVDPMFEYPFSNEDTSEKLLNYGEIETRQINNIEYHGDVGIGITMQIHITGPDVKNLVIWDVDTRKHIAISDERLKTLMGGATSPDGSSYLIYDTIIINSVRGNKTASILRDGKEVNIINCLERETDWFELHKGGNRFGFTVDSGVQSIQFYIYNKTAYEGI